MPGLLSQPHENQEDHFNFLQGDPESLPKQDIYAENNFSFLEQRSNSLVAPITLPKQTNSRSNY